MGVLLYGGCVRGDQALAAFPEEGLAVAVLRNANGNDGEVTSIVGQLRAALAP